MHERQVNYVNHNVDQPTVAEYNDVDPRHMLTRSEDWSGKEKKRFKKNNEKKKSGAVRLKGKKLKQAGKTASVFIEYYNRKL